MTHQRHIERATETLNWYAFRVEPQKELWAANLLRCKGLRVAVPCERVLRRRSKVARERTYRAKPLMPGSIWVCFEGAVNWHALFQHQFIKGVIGFGGIPARLDAEQVERMLSNQKAGVYTDSLLWRKMRTRTEYRIGDTVEIDAPGMDALRGRVIDMTDSHAKVLLPFLGSEHAVEVPIDAAVKAA